MKNHASGTRYASSPAVRWAFLAMLLLVFAGQAQQTEPGQKPARAAPAAAHVIMISLDGLLPDYYTTPARLGLMVPTLTEMRLNGAFAEGVEGVYPSVTYPAHTTLITGARPSVHGIVQNRIFEAPTAPQTREWYFFAEALTAPTLWSLAKQAGLTTAAVGWPVTAKAAIDYNVPEIFDPLETPPTARRSLPYATPGLLQKATAANPTADATTDGRRTAVSEYLIKEYKPNLLLVHLVDSDSVQHRYGPRSKEALAVIEREDGYIARLIEATKQAGIFAKTTFFIVSDHGFAGVEKVFSPNIVLAREKLITLDAGGKATDWKAAAWPAGGSCAIVLRDPNDAATAGRVREIFQAYLKKSGGPLNRVLLPEELKRMGAIPTAALMLEAASGFAFDDALTGDEVRRGDPDYRGTHGHLPTRAEMRAALVIYGAGVRVGAKVALAKMIDIAPTAAALLGFPLETAEGGPLGELLTPGLLPPPPPKAKTKPGKQPGS